MNQPSLVQIMACRLDGAKPLPEPMMEYCYVGLPNKLQWNFNQSSYIFIQEYAFENVVRKMAAILSRPKCLNSFCLERSASQFQTQFRDWYLEHMLQNWAYFISTEHYCLWANTASDNGFESVLTATYIAILHH